MNESSHEIPSSETLSSDTNPTVTDDTMSPRAPIIEDLCSDAPLDKHFVGATFGVNIGIGLSCRCDVKQSQNGSRVLIGSHCRLPLSIVGTSTWCCQPVALRYPPRARDKRRRCCFSNSIIRLRSINSTPVRFDMILDFDNIKHLRSFSSPST